MLKQPLQGTLTQEMVDEARKYSDPAALAILADPDINNGATSLSVRIMAPGLQEAITYVVGTENEDNTRFNGIATQKEDVSVRTGLPSRIAVQSPWNLQKGNYIYTGSATSADGEIIVSVSALKGEADETVAKIILAAIEMIYLFQLRFMNENKISQI